MQIKLSSTAIRHLQEIIDSHFMYLTDYREYSLQDVITQLEPELFRKVTGLTLKDFGLLVGLGVFNRELMNDIDSNHYNEYLYHYDYSNALKSIMVTDRNPSLPVFDDCQKYYSI